MLPSRIGELFSKEQEQNCKRIGKRSYLQVIGTATVVVFSLGGAAWAYAHLGSQLQREDPSVGWLDIGTCSIPLFAAWSCMLGIAIAGLLPVITALIGKKGGKGKWKRIENYGWQVLVYVGYLWLLSNLL